MAQATMQCECRANWAPRCPDCRTCWTCCRCGWTLTGLQPEDLEVLAVEEPAPLRSCWRADRLGKEARCD